MATMKSVNVSIEDQVYATNVNMTGFSGIPPLMFMDIDNELVFGAKVIYDVNDASRILFPSYSAANGTVYLTSIAINAGTVVPAFSKNNIKVYLGSTN